MNGRVGVPRTSTPMGTMDSYPSTGVLESKQSPRWSRTGLLENRHLCQFSATSFWSEILLKMAFLCCLAPRAPTSHHSTSAHWAFPPRQAPKTLWFYHIASENSDNTQELESNKFHEIHFDWRGRNKTEQLRQKTCPTCELLWMPVKAVTRNSSKNQPLWEGLAVPTYPWDRTILKKINTAKRMQGNLGRTTTYGKPQEKNNKTKLDPLTLFSKIMPERPGEQGRAMKLWQRQRTNECQGRGRETPLKTMRNPSKLKDAPSTLVKCDRKEMAAFLWGLRQEKQRPLHFPAVRCSKPRSLHPGSQSRKMEILDS